MTNLSPFPSPQQNFSCLRLPSLNLHPCFRSSDVDGPFSHASGGSGAGAETDCLSLLICYYQKAASAANDSSLDMYYRSLPPHCLANLSALPDLPGGALGDGPGAAAGNASALIAPLQQSPSESGCYDELTRAQRDQFLQYEMVVGGYCNVIVGLIGLVGNILSLVVLGQQEMQKNNCFNKLLIGEEQKSLIDVCTVLRGEAKAYFLFPGCPIYVPKRLALGLVRGSGYKLIGEWITASYAFLCENYT